MSIFQCQDRECPCWDVLKCKKSDPSRIPRRLANDKLLAEDQNHKGYECPECHKPIGPMKGAECQNPECRRLY